MPRVLIIEDEALIAMLVDDALTRDGHTVVARPASVEDGRAAIAQGGFDVAILDVNLQGETSVALASLLSERKIPFIITTGYTDFRFENAPVLYKPFDPDDLCEAIRQILQD